MPSNSIIKLKVFVGIWIMHQVSQQTAQLAQKHALQSLEKGKLIEEVGKRWQSDNLLEEEIGQSIEESGKTIQEKAEDFLEKTQKLAEDNSVKVFSECLQAHVDANKSHIEAVSEYLRGLQTRLRQMK